LGAVPADQQKLTVRARLDAAAAQGDEPAVAALAARLPASEKLLGPARLAQAHAARDPGSINQAIEATRALADAEDDEPVSGPAFYTPAREQLGELFLRSHRFVEAEQAFRAALERRPGRRHAVLGLAEARLGAKVQ